jgi:hypothetical protein
MIADKMLESACRHFGPIHWSRSVWADFHGFDFCACGFLISKPQNFSSDSLARLSLRWNHLSDKKSRQINKLEHVLIGKVVQPRIKSGAGLCRNMLHDCHTSETQLCAIPQARLGLMQIAGKLAKFE